MLKIRVLFIAGLLVLCSSRPAQSQIIENGPAQTPLLELFSSEGCSSCPPADALVNTLTTSKRLWKDFVPVVFHVTYWDRLGWKDPFAQEAFNEKQRDYILAWRESALYTPAFVWNGRAWPEWSAGIPPEKKQEAVGKLRVEIKNARELSIHFLPQDQNKDSFVVHAALLGFGIESKVLRGENAGETLKHNFTALDYQIGPMQKRTGGYEASLHLAESRISDLKRLGIAVWVTEMGLDSPLQSAGGFIE